MSEVYIMATVAADRGGASSQADHSTLTDEARPPFSLMWDSQWVNNIPLTKCEVFAQSHTIHQQEKRNLNFYDRAFHNTTELTKHFAKFNGLLKGTENNRFQRPPLRSSG